MIVILCLDLLRWLACRMERRLIDVVHEDDISTPIHRIRRASNRQLGSYAQGLVGCKVLLSECEHVTHAVPIWLIETYLTSYITWCTILHIIISPAYSIMSIKTRDLIIIIPVLSLMT